MGQGPLALTWVSPPSLPPLLPAHELHEQLEGALLGQGGCQGGLVRRGSLFSQAGGCDWSQTIGERRRLVRLRPSLYVLSLGLAGHTKTLGPLGGGHLFPD